MAGALISCQGKTGSRVEIEDSDSIPENIKKIVHAVVNDDSVEFSKHVSFPLERPYPLHSINNEAEMTSYFRTMVDDSLKDVLGKSKPEHWEKHGWRGWSVHSGNYVWIDSLLYEVPYLSKSERRNLARMRSREINSLHKQYRGKWIPVAALTGEDGTMMRVDAKEGMERTAHNCMRLLIYKNIDSMRRFPYSELHGTLTIDGTALNEEYTFEDEKGNRVIWNPYQQDDTPLYMTFEGPDLENRDVLVKRIYWLDVIKGDSINW